MFTAVRRKVISFTILSMLVAFLLGTSTAFADTNDSSTAYLTVEHELAPSVLIVDGHTYKRTSEPRGIPIKNDRITVNQFVVTMYCSSPTGIQPLIIEYNYDGSSAWKPLTQMNIDMSKYNYENNLALLALSPNSSISMSNRDNVYVKISMGTVDTGSVYWHFGRLVNNDDNSDDESNNGGKSKGSKVEGVFPKTSDYEDPLSTITLLLSSMLMIFFLLLRRELGSRKQKL